MLVIPILLLGSSIFKKRFSMKSTTGVINTAREALACKISTQMCIDRVSSKAHSGSEKLSDTKRKTPLLNRIYYLREKLMHKLVESSLRLSSNAQQLLILGCGLDCSYETYDANTFAVDFESIIKQRKDLTNSKMACDNSNKTVKYISADLRDDAMLYKELALQGFDMKCPTVVLVECVLCYIDAVSVKKLLNSLRATLELAVLLMYDPIIPLYCESFDVGYDNGNAFKDVADENVRDKCSPRNGLNFSQFMENRFSDRGAPLLSATRTTEEQMLILQEANWPHAMCTTVNRAAKLFLSIEERSLNLELKRKSENENENKSQNEKVAPPLEYFDEFASLALLQSHYAITVAATDQSVFAQLFEKLTSWSRWPNESLSNAKKSEKLHLPLGENEPRQNQIIQSLLIRIAIAEQRLRLVEEKALRNKPFDR
jgi:O-methyltransferase involved in polyketide biosynthesis